MNLIPLFIRQRLEHRPNLIKIIDNIGWLFFDKILRMGVGLLVGVWVARYLGPEQFGLYSFATAFIGLFGAVAGLGLQSIVVRDIVRDPACKEETLGTAAILQFFGGLIAYGLIIATIFYLRPDDTMAKILVAILGSTMLFKIGDIATYWFESQVQSKYIVWVQNGCFLIFAAVKVTLILNQAPLMAFAWCFMAEALLVSLLMLAVFNRKISIRKLQYSLARTKQLLSDSWPLLLSGVAVVVYMRIDQIMLGQMMGDEAVGIYTAATRISEVWYFIPITIVTSVFPAILEAKKRSEEEYYRRLQQLYDLMVWLSVGVAIPMTFLSAAIVDLLFGENYSASAVVLSIHIWASVFVFLGVASGKWYLAESRQILAFQRTALGAVSNVIFNCILIPSFGAVGAAVATVISQATAAWLFDAVQPATQKVFLMKTHSMNPLRLFKLICNRKLYD
ncbi:flippase [Endozoicomonas ascidiicola]|uniref:flippase n=1 Tax=Endozoicomonas ascidiicola TaxID=1698521 RepID=UPI00082E1E41|nr:flippase [Endozoicomonas ascidiicola]